HALNNFVIEAPSVIGTVSGGSPLTESTRNNICDTVAQVSSVTSIRFISLVTNC
ncbi:hypothetical protein ACHAXS_011140, partial [Conticribra weissflogii]